MSLPLVFRSEVRTDVDEAYAWYEKRRSGLGDDFLASVKKVYDQIRDTPAFYPVVYRDVHFGVTKRFPYGVYYRIYPDYLLVLAVAHHRRHRRIWRSRA